MDYSSSIAPQALGQFLGELNWHKPKAKRLFVIWSLMTPVSLFGCLFLIGIPATFLSIYFARRSWQRWRSPQSAVLLYKYGLVNRRNPESVTLPYINIDTLRVAIIRLAGITGHLCTIQTKEGHKIQFDEHLAQIKDLGYILQEQVAQHQLPSAIATYRQGLPVSFQQLAVTTDSVVMGKRSLPWQDFDSANRNSISNS